MKYASDASDVGEDMWIKGAMKSCDGMSPSLAMMNGGGDEIGGDNTSARY